MTKPTELKETIDNISLGEEGTPTVANRPHLDLETNIDNVIGYLDDSTASFFDIDDSTTTGATFGYKGGRFINMSGNVVDVSNGTVVFGSDAHKYVYISLDTDTVTGGDSLPSRSIPLYELDVVGGVIDTNSIVDKRTPYVSRTLFGTGTENRLVKVSSNFDLETTPNAFFNTSGALVLSNGAGTLNLKSDGSVDHVNINFYARDSDLNTRSGFIGYPFPGLDILSIHNQMVDGTIRLQTAGSNDSIDLNTKQLNSTAALVYFNHGSPILSFDDVAPDGQGFKRISINDGSGNYNVRLNTYLDGSTEKYARNGGGASSITLEGDSTDGYLVFKVAEIGSATSTITWNQTLTIDSIDGLSFTGTLAKILSKAEFQDEVYFGDHTGTAEGLVIKHNGSYFGASADARVLQLYDHNGANGQVDGGLIIEGYTSQDDISEELLRVRNNEFKWKTQDIYHTGNLTPGEVIVSGNDTTSQPLINKLVGGNNITLTELNDGANEQIQIDVDSPLDADTLDGYDSNINVLAETIPVRNSFGYLYAAAADYNSGTPSNKLVNFSALWDTGFGHDVSYVDDTSSKTSNVYYLNNSQRPSLQIVTLEDIISSGIRRAFFYVGPNSTSMVLVDNVLFDSDNDIHTVRAVVPPAYLYRIILQDDTQITSWISLE